MRGQGLKPDDWNKGDRFWIVDLIAPYKGVGSYIMRWGRQPGNLPAAKIRYLRASDGTADVHRVVEMDLGAPKGSQIRFFSLQDFLALE